MSSITSTLGRPITHLFKGRQLWNRLPRDFMKITFPASFRKLWKKLLNLHRVWQKSNPLSYFAKL